MKLAVVRHAIAEERDAKRYPGDDRPLTKEGVVKMREAALGIAALADRPDIILSSPLIRARSTAEIVREAFALKTAIKTQNALLPESTPNEIISALRKFKSSGNVMAFGHEPSLSRFIAHILSETPFEITLKKGALCLLTVNSLNPPYDTILETLAQPSALRRIGEQKQKLKRKN